MERKDKLFIGENIRKIRELKRLTQEGIAKSLNMSVTAYGDIERGNSDVNFERLGEIAEALEVSIEDIVTYGYTVYNNNVAASDNAVSYVVNTGNPVHNDMAFINKVLKDKDDEIAFLREQLNKYTGKDK